ncbi:MAG: hypothetical protein IPJ61_01005 [Tessaracoccus sp.]|uniref:hypothetical protein n=1 Tax=Tessaracoccus sp. TaxID=1971211 RepID=UPI001EC480F9|nr:hypothetical protein [Tessaracoccus sp.]MBK7819673.1 hypothetical protein [Tessaracoccus sp.]
MHERRHRLVLGLIVTAWGLAVWLLAASQFFVPLPVVLLCGGWGVVYAVAGVTARLAAMQLVSLCAFAVVSAFLIEPSLVALWMVVLAVGFFALWMAPVGVYLSWRRGGQRGAQLHP